MRAEEVDIPDDVRQEIIDIITSKIEFKDISE